MEYRTLSNLFGTRKSTVCTVVVETCRAVADNLLGKYVNIPNGDLLKEVVQGFETVWGFPRAAGAIDGSHIPIKKLLSPKRVLQIIITVRASTQL